MTDKPIIFSGPMVRAIIDGRKTQTRRVIRTTGYANIFDGSWTDQYVLDDGNAEWRARYTPYAVGDRLWVKETWAKTPISPIISSIDDPIVVYRAYDARCDYGGPWKSPIFMPRAASRLTLIVEGVKVERLQDISEEDARAEGLLLADAGGVQCWRGQDRSPVTPCASVAFQDLWDSINAKRGYGWSENPWVVAVSFRPVAANIDRMEDE